MRAPPARRASSRSFCNVSVRTGRPRGSPELGEVSSTGTPLTSPGRSCPRPRRPCRGWPARASSSTRVVPLVDPAPEEVERRLGSGSPRPREDLERATRSPAAGRPAHLEVVSRQRAEQELEPLDHRAPPRGAPVEVVEDLHANDVPVPVAGPEPEEAHLGRHAAATTVPRTSMIAGAPRRGRLFEFLDDV